MKSSLFWRAVVQVHLERLFGSDCEISVGRSCSKANDFSEYFAKAEKASKRNLQVRQITKFVEKESKFCYLCCLFQLLL